MLHICILLIDILKNQNLFNFFQGHFNFEYQPLKVGEIQGRLELNCSDLGLYTYDLNLTATPGASEKAIYFRTCLGSSNMQVAKFLNFAKQRTDYICKVCFNIIYTYFSNWFEQIEILHLISFSTFVKIHVCMQ